MYVYKITRKTNIRYRSLQNKPDACLTCAEIDNKRGEFYKAEQSLTVTKNIEFWFEI